MTNPVLTTTALEIITAALQEVGAVDARQPVRADKSLDAMRDLNYMIKTWQGQGLHLWSKTEGVLFLDQGKTDYGLGPTGDNCANADDFINTQMAVAGIATDRTLTLDSTAGLSGADDILAADPTDSTQGWTVVGGTFAVIASQAVVSNAAGVAGEIERSFGDLVIGRSYQVNSVFFKGTSASATYSIKTGAGTLATETLFVDGTSRLVFTATQESVTFGIKNGDISGTNTSLTLSVALLDESTADYIGIRLDDGTRQWSRIIEVLNSTDVLNVDGLTGPSAIDRSVFTFSNLISRPLRLLQLRRFTVGMNDEIEANKWSRQQYFAQPDKNSQGQINNWYYTPQLSDGRLYVWQTASDVDQVAKFTYERPLEVFEDNSEAPDFPAEWFETLKMNLADKISVQYKTSPDRRAEIKSNAAILLNDILGFDEEDSSMNVQPDMGMC